jgi:hypothetical protein
MQEPSLEQKVRCFVRKLNQVFPPGSLPKDEPFIRLGNEAERESRVTRLHRERNETLIKLAVPMVECGKHILYIILDDHGEVVGADETLEDVEIWFDDDPNIRQNYLEPGTDRV